jgi:uncharacterized protein (TIGR03000 family)
MIRGVFLKLSFAAALGLLLFADAPKAQAWGWGRPWGGYGYGRWGYYGPYTGYYGSGYYGWTNPYGYNWAYPYAYSGWSWPSYYGYYGGWPYYSYAYYPYTYFPWTGSVYSYYGTNYAPHAEYGVIGSSKAYGYAPETTTESASSYGATASIPDNAVLISVKVPPDAEIWFDNFKTKQTGEERRFVSPSLDTNQNFSYQVRARWMEGDRQVEQTRKITVHAGEPVTVDFTSRPVPTP